MADEPVRVAYDSGFPPFAEVKDDKSVGLAMDRVGIDVEFGAGILRAETAHFG